MKIGYQGIMGSHSQKAAKELAANVNILNAEFIPLVSSANVVKSLLDGDIDYGVVASYNSIGGVVSETDDALNGVNYMKITAIVMNIHQCIFKKNSSVRNTDINKVASHIQALRQTQLNVKRLFPYAKLKEIEDTAIGARNLSEGVYDKYTAVICSAEAGEAYGLDMMYENIEDNDSNRTMFMLIDRK